MFSVGLLFSSPFNWNLQDQAVWKSPRLISTYQNVALLNFLWPKLVQPQSVHEWKFRGLIAIFIKSCGGGENTSMVNKRRRWIVCRIIVLGRLLNLFTFSRIRTEKDLTAQWTGKFLFCWCLMNAKLVWFCAEQRGLFPFQRYRNAGCIFHRGLQEGTCSFNINH